MKVRRARTEVCFGGNLNVKRQSGLTRAAVGMRKALVNAVKKHRTELFKNPSELFGALKEAPELMFHVMLPQQQFDVMWQCTRCHGRFGAANKSNDRETDIVAENVMCPICHFRCPSRNLVQYFRAKQRLEELVEEGKDPVQITRPFSKN